MTVQSVILVAGVGLLAGVVNTLAGAGSLVTIPALVFMGVSATVANATNRVGVVLQSSAATLTFHRKGALDHGAGWRLMAPTCVGALAGAWVSAVIDPAIFEKVVAVVMLGVLAVTLFPGLIRRWRWPESWSRAPLFAAVGFYGGFLQAGVGLLLLAALQAAEGLDLARGNAVKSMLVAGFTAVSLVLFGAYGLIDWPLAAALALGSTLGGWIGSHLALAGGERLIKVALTLTVLASSSRLMGLW